MGEDRVNIVDVKARKIAGSWRVFDRRYEPIPYGGSDMRNHDQIADGTDARNIWTVLDCDGVMYVAAGLHYVNRMGYVVTKHAWSDVEETNPGYVY